MHKKPIVFVSTMALVPWGGSEELWSQTALNLAAQGFAITASVTSWSPFHNRIQALMQGGIDVWAQTSRGPLWKRAWRKVSFRRDTLLAADVRKLIAAKAPLLIVFSAGGVIPPVDLLELCVAKQVPFVTVGQANGEYWWPDDELAERYRNVLPAAIRCYFVSRGNLRLFEKQIGCELSNTEIVRNPFNVEFDASPPWPLNTDGEILFACVGRLHPQSKGQDILLESLAASIWSNRKWRLTLYGEGPMKNSLQRLVKRLSLEDRVFFAGYTATVKDIWASNQVLVMPSRSEGLPLAMVEAMLCGRPVIATNIAGHSEIIDDGITGFLAEAPTVPSMLRALERFWARRTEIEYMGRMAREKIRQIIPPDPIAEFATKIKGFVGPRCM